MEITTIMKIPKDAKALLDNYKNVTVSLFKEYKVYKRKLFSEEWVEFNTNIAVSLNYLYRTSIPLFRALINYNNDYKYKDFRYYSFYYDFIVTKPSNTIFTETPKDVKVNLFPFTPKGIKDQNLFLFRLIRDYSLYNKLYKKNQKDQQNHSWIKNIINFFKKVIFEITKPILKILYFIFWKTNIEDKKRENFEEIFDTYFQIFFTRTFLFYDFIYYKDEGVFAKYRFKKEDNIELFDRTKKVFERFLNVNDPSKKREFYLKAVIVATNEALPEKDRFTSEDISRMSHNEIYKNYVTHQKKYQKQQEKLIKFEPFTYILAHKIWKFDRIYQNRLEGINDSKGFHESMKTFIDDSLKCIDDYYSNDIDLITLFERIAKIDKDILAEIYKEYLPDIQNIDDNFCNTVNSGEETDGDKINENESIEIESIVKYMYDKDKHEKLKFHRILERASKKELELLLNHYHSLIDSEIPNDEQCKKHFFGILRSGSFLAHAVNAISKSHKPSLSLITHPYLTVLPRQKFPRNNQGQTDKKQAVKAIYIDEAIKSGYSVNIADTYRKKLLIDDEAKDCASQLFTIIDVKNFKKKSIEKSNIKYKSLAEFTFKNDDDIDIKMTKVNNIKQFNWSEYLNGLSDITPEESKKIESLSSVSDDKYDLTKVISCTDILFTIGKAFAKQINKLSEGNKKDILMYAGSSEGKLLADITVFVYKQLYDSNVSFCLEPKYKTKDEIDCSCRLFFDISVVSGSTLEHTKLRDAMGTDFNCIFTIAKESSYFKKDIFNIFDFTEKQSEESAK